MKSILEAIASRRSVKPDRFTGEVIEDDRIMEAIRAANWAPTHGLTEPWRFVVFTGKGKLELLQFINKLDEEINGFNEVRQKKRSETFNQISHIIAIGMKRGENPKIPELEELLAVAMAVQNFWLAAEELGFGGYWSTGELAFTDQLRAFIGLSPGDKSLGFFYAGIPKEERPQGRRMSSAESKVVWKT
jgi:nitroreductase